MQNTSSLYKELIKQSGRLFKAEIAVTFSNCSRATLTDENIMQDSLSITTGTTDEGSFSIGNAVIAIELIDMTHSSVFNRTNCPALLIDGVHPTLKGHQLMGAELAQKINFKGGTI